MIQLGRQVNRDAFGHRFPEPVPMVFCLMAGCVPGHLAAYIDFRDRPLVAPRQQRTERLDEHIVQRVSRASCRMALYTFSLMLMQREIWCCAALATADFMLPLQLRYCATAL